MARSIYSRSPSPSVLSPSYSDSSDESLVLESGDQPDNLGPSVSRPGSPASQAPDVPEAETVTCLWEDCGDIFTNLRALIDHIHNDHIGVHKSNYTCEWATCSRRGLAQTSRFALISHIRSHTGEKPFTCPRPECDKSFTRSDALAKHMRLQHNISPPLPGRGGNRKRKRDPLESEPTEPPVPSVPQSQQPSSSTTFSTFKVEPQTPAELPPMEDGYFGSARSSPVSEEDENADIPAYLLQVMDPNTGLIMGRSPDMVRYIIMKAKYEYAIGQHESLLEELRVVRCELSQERELKENVLDNFLRATFGAQAEMLVEPIQPIQTSHSVRHSAAVELS